jgi:hypothetical protein
MRSRLSQHQGTRRTTGNHLIYSGGFYRKAVRRRQSCDIATTPASQSHYINIGPRCQYWQMCFLSNIAQTQHGEGYALCAHVFFSFVIKRK